jgi:TRAP-type C4-dicarboxylate transport system permease large subunit
MAFSAATLASAATIDILIPPSIPMILFALSANASIAALFVAGVLPGLLMCGGFMAACWWVGKRRNLPRETAPVSTRAAFRRHLCLRVAAVVLPVLIIVFLRFGIATPTEVAVLSTLYAGLVSALIYRDLGLEAAAPRHRRGGAGHRRGAAGDHGLGRHRLAAHLRPDAAGRGAWVQQNVDAKWLVILLMNVMMLFLGMFIDLPAAVLLLTPVFVPLANASAWT